MLVMKTIKIFGRRFGLDLFYGFNKKKTEKLIILISFFFFNNLNKSLANKRIKQKRKLLKNFFCKTALKLKKKHKNTLKLTSII